MNQEAAQVKLFTGVFLHPVTPTHRFAHKSLFLYKIQSKLLVVRCVGIGCEMHQVSEVIDTFPAFLFSFPS